jgi:hypothetical protein
LHPEPLEWSIAEIDAAIELVASGHAIRVSLCELPSIAAAAAFGLAHAHAAGIPIVVKPDPGGAVAVIIGPRSVDTVADRPT